MARTLAEVDADLAAVETQLSNLIPQLVDARNRLEGVESRVSRIIKGLKAVIKRIKPNGITLNAFDHWESGRRMERIRKWWMTLADNETDDLDDA